VIDNDDVRQYYDANTRSFMRFGQGRGTDTIRRAIWAPGVRTKEDAFHFVDGEIARRLELGRQAGTRILDLGCGIGGSLLWLARRFDIEGTGVTLSPVQAKIAGDRVRARGGQLRGSVTVVARDLHEFVPPEPQDAAIAIESFVHVPDAGAFFRQAKRILRPSGLLILIDDFLATRGPGSEFAQGVVDDFRRGWRVRTLVTVEDALAAARSAGFEPADDVDLTPFLELGRPRDVAIRYFLGAMRVVAPAALGRQPRFANLLGGDALQRGLRARVLQHRLVVFRA
jgi:cyclopropane fatty-acyl-phospholipid synthase-like methyltransferase